MSRPYLFLIALVLITTILAGQSSSPDETSSRWIVKLNVADYEAFNLSNDRSGQQYFKKISTHFQLVNLISVSELTKAEALKHFSNMDILSIFIDEPLTKRETIPDDFLYDNQWNMDLIQMPRVWDHLTGGFVNSGEDIVVAVLDDGFKLDHIDLEDNLYSNLSEIPGDFIDNDKNGIVDDYNGYNVNRMNGDHFIMDHGTKVAGIIGAKGNNSRGVSGVNWDVKLMPISGVDYVGEIVESLEYIVMMKKKYVETNGREGANILVNNLSSGIDRKFPAYARNWCDLYDIAGEVGILSVGAAPNSMYNVETEGDLPSLCPSDYLIMVTNTDRNDFKVNQAGVGEISIDLGAPGEMVTTTTLKDEYDVINGTSGSAPHVAGVAALLYSIDCPKFADLIKTKPAAAAALVKDAILAGVDLTGSLDQTVSGGRLNAYESFLNLVGWCTGIPPSGLDITNLGLQNRELVVEYNTNDFDRHYIDVFNAQGQLIKSDTFLPLVFQAKEVRLHLDYLDLPEGIYIVTISNETSRVTKKVSVFRN